VEGVALVRELWVWEQLVGMWAVVGTVIPGGLLGFDITWTTYSERKPALGWRDYYRIGM
jgi:hypothetical protein